MQQESNHKPVVDPSPVEITGQRELTVQRATGRVHWRVTEFNGGRYMLIAEGASTQFSVHFGAEQWVAFQELIAGERHVAS